MYRHNIPYSGLTDFQHKLLNPGCLFKSFHCFLDYFTLHSRSHLLRQLLFIQDALLLKVIRVSLFEINNFSSNLLKCACCMFVTVVTEVIIGTFYNHLIAKPLFNHGCVCELISRGSAVVLHISMYMNRSQAQGWRSSAVANHSHVDIQYGMTLSMILLLNNSYISKKLILCKLHFGQKILKMPNSLYSTSGCQFTLISTFLLKVLAVKLVSLFPFHLVSFHILSQKLYS